MEAVGSDDARQEWNRVAPRTREEIVKLRRRKYARFNDQHFTEKLAAEEGLMMSRATVRRGLRAAGIGVTYTPAPSVVGSASSRCVEQQSPTATA